MKKFLKEKTVYLMGNIIILIIGYFLIHKGLLETDKNNATIFISIGTSLIATSIVLFLDLWRIFAKDNVLKKVNSIIFDAGVNDIFKKRKLDKYDSLILDVKDEICISGYSLSGFYESYKDILIDKLNNSSSLKIKILIVDPSSEFSRDRERLEGNATGIFLNNINKLNETFSVFDNVEIKSMKTPLTTMIYKIDDVLFIGPHFYKTSSASTPTMELSRSGWMYDAYMSEFYRMWDDSNTLTLSN